MKQIILFFFLILFLAISACNKNDEINAPKEFPAWVNQKVADLTANGESCKIVFVMIYEIDGKKYYNIDFAYSSCAMCNVFDENGNQVTQQERANWKEIKFIDMFPGCK